MAAMADPGPTGPDLSTSLAAAEFPAPVFTASGCAAAGRELAPFFDLTEIGGVVTKSIMMSPRSGRKSRMRIRMANAMPYPRLELTDVAKASEIPMM